MVPATGDVYEIRRELLGGYETGDSLDMDTFRANVEALGTLVTENERKAAKAPALVLIEEQAAQRLKLGAREQERRRSRRKAEKRARRTQR